MTKDEARRRVIAYWKKKEETALLSALSEYEEQRYDFAVNRDYYACFYSASAVLLQLGQKFVKHAGVRAAVHRDLVKAGKLDPTWGKAYDRIFESRQSANYLELYEFEADQVAELLQAAKNYLKEMPRLLTTLSSR